MPLIGYVSDERYVALPDVLLEFSGEGRSVEARSRAGGSVHADVPPGDYEVVLSKQGYGSKRVRMTARLGEPYQFRLLSDCLLGYVWPKWVKAGDEAEFRVHAVEAYKLELWRYGLEKEFLRNLGWHDEHGPRATMQITPDGDYTQTGVRWNQQGYNIKVHRQFVAAPEHSGLYYFHAGTASGAFFSFPWIVAPRRPTCKLAVLASNITWNAYNAFGGRSNYIHADCFPATPTVNSRQELKRYTDPDHLHYDRDDYAPLSFDRPEPINSIAAAERATDPIEGRAACHVAPAEWRFLAWLARERFAYDLYAETQFHQGAFDLGDYRALVLSTHPEYWSRSMYERLKRWVFEEGGKLLYLGGNGMNCEVEFIDDATIICRNGDQREMKRRKLESRFHLRHESEANLLGVVFTEAGAMTAAPFRVVDAGHWAFAGTDLNAGDAFGRRSLHRRCDGGASGHETDKISPSSPKNVHLLAQGTNRDDGGAHMIYYDTSKGGEVFSAASITWTSSLLVDDAVSKITANVLRRFLKEA
ncbi:MAG TPA: N,N-dimethylformamidase beta subunit family domain-containing protein [Pirellulales bacterium]|nr:N,N-dimethylformamidase beta subunit family domain-containing protein [Pirellulales bacterium]